MGLPSIQDARPFYRSAKQRFLDAEFLLDAERTTGAVYLAGYCVECMLKALILCTVAPNRRAEAFATFRGARAHDFDWLKASYRKCGGYPLPSDVSKAFSLVETWTTDLRYKAGTVKRRDAEEFLQAVRGIIVWADGRL